MEMTRREFFEAVKALEGIDAELNLFAEKELAKMDERNAKRQAKPSAKALENEPIKKKIMEHLNAIANVDAPQTAAEIAGEVKISTQKASALLKQLAEDGKVAVSEVKVKGKGKRKAYAAVL